MTFQFNTEQTASPSSHHAVELAAAYERIAELEDLARNVAGIDINLVMHSANLHFFRATFLEWQDQAQELLP